jgi:hypothetical protein
MTEQQKEWIRAAYKDLEKLTDDIPIDSDVVDGGSLWSAYMALFNVVTTFQYEVKE